MHENEGTHGSYACRLAALQHLENVCAILEDQYGIFGDHCFGYRNSGFRPPKKPGGPVILFAGVHEFFSVRTETYVVREVAISAS